MTGVNYTKVTNNLGLSSYYIEYQTVDTDDEEYTRIVISDNINEIQKYTFLDVKLGLQYRINLSSKLKLNISANGMYSLNLNNEYESDGIFSYQGYYPQYNITLYDLPQYNFASNQNLETKGDLDLGSSISLLLGLGMELRLSEGINLQLEGYYQQGLNNISKNKTESYIISDNPSDFNSIISASSETKLSGYGLSIGLVFVL